MKKTNWKDIAELIGLASIVASLLFVGMQMKQSQRIAVAGQYHNRAALTIEHFGNLMSNALTPTTGLGNVLIEIMPDATPEVRSYAYLFFYSFHTLADNHLYQYQSGFLDEEAWQPRRAQIANVLSIGKAPQFVCLQLEFRSSYKQLCEELIAENDENSGER